MFPGIFQTLTLSEQVIKNLQNKAMNIYFFSNHTADTQMLKDLGAPLKAQFRSPISDIHRKGNQIAFTETIFMGGQTIKSCHTIPAESIVVVEGSILLQDAWLKAGVTTLLVPQIHQEMDAKGKVLFKYDGLLQVQKIEVLTSKWTSKNAFSGENKDQETLTIH